MPVAGQLLLRKRICQERIVPGLNTLKTWLESNAGRVAKGTLIFTAMDYTFNQLPTSVGYCARGDLKISNVLSERAIHPFFWLKSMAICRYLAGRPYQCNVLLPDGSCESRQPGILGLYSACSGEHC
ncbi:IS66 family transposase [Marinobacter sp. BSs20148]|uniref:IS66 family transposase n=1 Tax=Marinobacter sp. BSs20148 TaxID=490759 RepID=UPI00117E4300|nr:transposase [Marinobacter sp. BSs20148]